MSGLLALRASVRRNGQALPVRLLWGPGLGNPSPEEREVRGYTEPQAVALLASGSVQQLAPGKLTTAGQPLGAVRWLGIESHYFAALFVAPGGGAEGQVRAVSLPGHGDDKPIAAAVATIDANAAEPVQLFVGAKDHEQMVKLGHQLERVVQVGDWIGPIVIALMGLLRWVHGHVGNWGWSIVLLTVLINLAMAPFRHYSIVNGLKMAKISPEMKAIQERYRKVPLMDPKRQVDAGGDRRALREARDEHGLADGGRLPAAAADDAVPVRLLPGAERVVELRGAPFLWITDLAQKDPLFITPVLMGVSMFAMQKMTPSAMDPAQQRIMMLMPLMLAGMFLWAPAGLNLYWLTSNLWSILQQWVEMSLLRPQEATPAAREAQVKDRLFSGTDVEDALASAAASLGLPRAELRYVVLEPGGGGGRGLSATPARIAVLIHDPAGPRGRRGRAAPTNRQSPGRAARPSTRPPDAADVHAGVRAVVRARRGGRRVRPRVRRRTTASRRSSCSSSARDCPFFLGEDGKGDRCDALEHLLQRMYGESAAPAGAARALRGLPRGRDLRSARKRVRLAGGGPRGGRSPQTLEPHERVRTADRPRRPPGRAGVRTYSVGEGPERRVTIAPGEPPVEATSASPHASRARCARDRRAGGREARRYLDTLAAWSPRVNLTAARTSRSACAPARRRRARRGPPARPGPARRRRLRQRLARPRLRAAAATTSR